MLRHWFKNTFATLEKRSKEAVIVIVSSHEFGRTIIVKATLSYPLLVTTALAFITRPAYTGYQRNLRAIFGEKSLRRFCIDFVDTNAYITFSSIENPEVLRRSVDVVQISETQADTFRLYLSETVATRSGTLYTDFANLPECLSSVPVSVTEQVDTDE